MRITAQVFWKISFNWNLPDGYLTVRLGLYIFGGGEDHRGCHFPSLHIEDVYYHHDLPIFMMTLTIWPRYCLSDFSTLKLLFFFPFHILQFVRKLLSVANTSLVVNYSPLPWAQTICIHDWNSLARKICLFSVIYHLSTYLIIQQFISLVWVCFFILIFKNYF